MADDLTAGNEDAADRLLAAVAREAWIGAPFDVPAPDPLQVAMVLRALADHTTIVRAMGYSRDYPRGSGVVDTLDPSATSLGRWFHALADRILDRARLG